MVKKKKERSFGGKIHDKFYSSLDTFFNTFEEFFVMFVLGGFVISLVVVVELNISLMYYMVANLVIAELFYWTSDDKPKKNESMNSYVFNKKVEYFVTSFALVIPMLMTFSLVIYGVYHTILNYYIAIYDIACYSVLVIIVGYIWIWLNRLKFRND